MAQGECRDDLRQDDWPAEPIPEGHRRNAGGGAEPRVLSRDRKGIGGHPRASPAGPDADGTSG